VIEARRRAYLEALGLDVWITRSPAAERGRVGVGTGEGSALLVCPSVEDCSTEIAGDLARALGGDPVWAWLDPATETAGQFLEDIVADRLITRVVLFGPEPGRSLFKGPVPALIGSAVVAVAPALEELAANGSARQALWRQLRNEHVAAQKNDSR
jgi:DNA polymerase III psi subunit